MFDYENHKSLWMFEALSKLFGIGKTPPVSQDSKHKKGWQRPKPRKKYKDKERARYRARLEREAQKTEKKRRGA